MKYNYYDSNKIVIHGKAVPGQTLAWGETKTLAPDKMQSINTTVYWGCSMPPVFSATSSIARSWTSYMVCASTTMAQECMTKYLAVGQVWTQWQRNIIISAHMCSVWTILYEWWIGMEKIHGIFSNSRCSSH